MKAGKNSVGPMMVLVSVLGGAAPVLGGAHLWRFNEVYSNADGTIQFIEMKECCGATSEIGLNNKWILAVNTGTQFTFDHNLSGNTSNKHLLLATAGFAALPGMPTPDFIIPDAFVPLNGDTMEYWFYSQATWTFGAGELPTDGVYSLNVDHTIGVNSPTNFAGETGSITPPCEGDANADDVVDPLDAGFILARMGCDVGTGDSDCDASDQNVDGLVDPLDVGFVLARFGECL